jgi:hypothetical protein
MTRTWYEWWYYILPATIADRWHHNIVREHGEEYTIDLLNGNSKVSLERFIDSQFIWAASVEGHPYWQNIFHQAENDPEGLSIEDPVHLINGEVKEHKQTRWNMEKFILK